MHASFHVQYRERGFAQSRLPWVPPLLVLPSYEGRRYAAASALLALALIKLWEMSFRRTTATEPRFRSDNKGSATFTISAASGVFAGLVVLPGTVRVTLIPGTPEDTAQYRATIAT
jgi:hypothetical protein